MGGRRRSKRIRRHHLKRWSSATIKTTERSPKGWTTEYHHRARSIDDQWAKMIGLPQTIATDARIEALKTLERLTNAVPITHNITLIDGPTHKRIMFYSTAQPIVQYFFIERTTIEIRRSIVYPSRRFAMYAHLGNNIQWEKREKFPPPV